MLDDAQTHNDVETAAPESGASKISTLVTNWATTNGSFKNQINAAQIPIAKQIQPRERYRIQCCPYFEDRCVLASPSEYEIQRA